MIARATRLFPIVALGVLVAVLLIAAPVGAAFAQLGWVPIPEEEARLELDPFQFPNQSRVRRFVGETLPARYERATTNFDASQRFFHVILRQRAVDAAPVQTDPDLQETVTELWNMPDPGQVVFGQVSQALTPLGEATYQPFEFITFQCVVFAIPFGEMSGSRHVDSVRGFFCDPRRRELDPATVQATLAGIRVLAE